MDISKYQDKKEIRKNAIYLSSFLLLLGFIQMLFGKNLFLYFYLAGFFVLIIGLFLPKVIRPVIIALHYVGFYLGMVNSKILLIIFYYLFVSPIGFLLRLIKKNPLDLKIKKDAGSYWIKRENVGFEKKDFENQF